MTSSSTWKNAERQTAKYLGGERKPADGMGGVDVYHPLFAIEVKYRSKLPRLIKDAVEQAEGNIKGEQVAIAVLRERGTEIGEAIVCLRLKDFRDLCG